MFNIVLTVYKSTFYDISLGCLCLVNLVQTPSTRHTGCAQVCSLNCRLKVLVITFNGASLAQRMPIACWHLLVQASRLYPYSHTNWFKRFVL